jgi:glycosyltransferase involved in cell wall biosynthesis
MNLLLTFTVDTSLKSWNKIGILSREILLYTKLSQKNVRISFLTYGDKSDLDYSKELADIKIIPCNRFVRSKISLLKYFKTLMLSLRLKELFSNADIIKTNQTLGGLVGGIAKIIYRKKFIVRGGYERLFNYMVKAKKKGIKNYFKYLINYLWIYLHEFIVYKLADSIILTNYPDISFIVKAFKLKRKKKNNKIHHIYNYIDTNHFKPLNLPIKENSVLYVGRLTYGKNLFNLIRAFKDLDGFSLDIVGTGPLEYDLRITARELGVKVNFYGLVSNELLPEIINQYQIFILPSYFEGNPKALLEAMSCGITCIGSDIKGINNVISHNVNGYLCKLDSDSIKEAINLVHQNKKLREIMGKNARDYVIINCDLDTIAQKEYSLYQNILKKKSQQLQEK